MGTRIAADVEVRAKAQFQITREVVSMTTDWKAMPKVMTIITMLALGLSFKATSAVTCCFYNIDSKLLK